MYKLLTSGPLTTSETVKNAMLIDHCTWDQEYKEITQWIRKKLLDLAQVSSGLITELNTDSTPKELLPCIKTVVYIPSDT